MVGATYALAHKLYPGAPVADQSADVPAAAPSSSPSPPASPTPASGPTDIDIEIWEALQG